ncbi:MAG TPA: hypothetical protein VII59_00575, partial [Streptosporangiaceae bacterium]
KILVAAAVVISAALWVLRLAGVVNGWVLFWGVALVAVALRAHAAARTAETPTPTPTPTFAGDPTPTPGPTPTFGSGSAEDPVPIEWWGLSRPWRAEDEEVLDRAIARG